MDAAVDQLAKITRVHMAAIAGVRKHYESIGLLEVPVPVLVGITGACENVSTLFKVQNARRIHLTQTGQLALEHALQFTSGLYCVTKSFRTDHIDERHLNEFTLIEEEFACTHPSVNMNVRDYSEDQMFDALLDHVTDAIQSMIRNALDRTGDVLRSFAVDTGRLQTAATSRFRRITYTEAVRLLNSCGNQAKEIRWGEDLRPEHERRLLELVALQSGAAPLPTFVTHFPKDIKFFNMKVHDKYEDVVDSADLLLPGVGEAVGSAVREHDYGRLVARLTQSVMFRHIQDQGLASLDDFAPYLEVIRKGETPPHCGYGIGLERVLQFIIGGDDVRLSSVPYLLSALMGFNRQLELMQAGSNAPGF